MDAQAVIKNLHPLEVKVILSYPQKAELTAEGVEKTLSLKSGNGNQALSWLCAKGVVGETRREKAVYYEITATGLDWKQNGSPEEKIAAFVGRNPGKTLPEIASGLNIDNRDAGRAFGQLSQAGILAMDGEKRVASGDGAKKDGYFAPIKSLLEKGADAASAGNGLVAENALSDAEKAAVKGLSKKRGAGDSPFRTVEKETVFFAFTGEHAALAAALKAAGISGDEAGELTREMLESGSWKGKTFRAYNINVPPARLVIGRTNPYASFLEGVKDKLASLGFEEFDGSLVETEFWNSDALFMPQFHAARDIHDVYHIKDPARAASIEEPHLSNVAAAHENGGNTGSRGWNYAFDRDFTKRLILRSQGTAISARTLPHANIPGKYFGIVRCFRYDKVDATHLSDFYQTEGIVLGEEVNLRTLLGFLKMFAEEVAGAKEVKYVPGYFPFTEPSVEVHIKHPVLGWFEMGGSGIFRPEVTASLGVNVPVAAWGIGIDRMALLALGLSDLRELFSYSLEDVRLRRL
ncbi:MAG: phenylalanine--tRNA ligase subunit alpha [Spirochaetaceae bacterium]|jgi:phenylalanyl-tRNA synthetase alpha chain|nr:phenylalanine--tRNA ligase subunit alpha [Spirochaetaceae bacterium]